jgi:hypothetical protein
MIFDNYLCNIRNTSPLNHYCRTPFTFFNLYVNRTIQEYQFENECIYPRIELLKEFIQHLESRKTDE